MCVKGYQKKVILIKNVGSEVFEEAFFIVNSEEKTQKISHATMVAEAKRIIEENFGITKRRFKFLKFKTSLAFLLGFVLSLIMSLTLF
jgi:hypothetical protein